MKIAVLSSHTPSFFWFRMDMMKLFVALGCEVVAIANEPEEKWEKEFRNEKIKYRQINVNRNSTNPIKDLKSLLSITKILKEERPDKVFSYHAKTVIYGGLAARLLKNNEVYPLIAGLGSVYMSDRWQDKIIGKLLTIEYKISLKNSKKVFFQNKDDSSEFFKRKILSEEKVAYLSGSGVNTEIFKPTPLPKSPCFLYIGRLIRDKGIQEYLDACKTLKEKNNNIRCMIVGPYDTNPTALKKEELEQYVSSGIVEYYGEQRDIKPYMDQCSVFVLPSYREGTPKTVLEAMASGRVVITTDAPGCRETVQNGINGYLVPARNTEILVEKMLELSQNFTTVLRMGQAGRELAEKIFDVRIVNRVITQTMGFHELGEKSNVSSAL